MNLIRFIVVVCLVVLGMGVAAPPARAHEFRPATLSVVERPDGQIDATLVSPKMTTAGPPSLTVVWPEHCRATAATAGARETTTLDCGELGLVGELAVTGLDRFAVEVVATVRWANGSTAAAVLRAEAPSLTLSHDPDAMSAARSFFAVGAEHMLGGLDHLLFVAGLMLLIGLRTRRLVGAITAFTVAHSITLALSVLDVWRPAVAPIEAAIALSIVFVAVEVRRGGPSLAHHRPWLVALLFGLLHGFGFSAALRDTGLPEQHLPVALLAFNVGLEAAQLAFVLVVVAIAAGLSPRLATVSRERLRFALATAMGSVAAYWALQQISQFWSMS